MKSFRIMSAVVICMITISGSSLSAYGQAGRVTKGIIGLFSKKSAKKGAKEVTEEVVEKSVKKGAKEGAEKTLKAAYEEIVQTIISKSSSVKLTSNVSKKTTLEAIRMTGEINIQHSFANVISKNIGKRLFLIQGGKSMESHADNVAMKVFIKKKGTIETVQTLEHRAARLMTQEMEKKATEKAAIKYADKRIGKVSLEMLDDVPDVREAVHRIQKNAAVAFSDDKLYVEAVGRSRKVGFSGTASHIIIDDKGVIHASSGMSGKSDAVNEFLNTPLPNKKYCVDNAAIFTTDGFGRTIKVECHSSALDKSISGASQEVSELKAKSSRDVKESINRLSMDVKSQCSGKWTKFEAKGKTAIIQGNDVWNTKIINYNPDGTFSVKQELRVTDPRTGKTKFMRKSFNDIKPL